MVSQYFFNLQASHITATAVHLVSFRQIHLNLVKVQALRVPLRWRTAIELYDHEAGYSYMREELSLCSRRLQSGCRKDSADRNGCYPDMQTSIGVWCLVLIQHTCTQSDIIHGIVKRTNTVAEMNFSVCLTKRLLSGLGNFHPLVQFNRASL